MFRFVFVPNGPARSRRPNLNFKLSRDFFHFTRHYFFRRNIGKFYNEVLWITRL